MLPTPSSLIQGAWRYAIATLGFPVGRTMNIASQQPALADRVYRENRKHSVLRTTMITAVTLGAAVLVTLTGFAA
jgi:hypothetical protein